MGRPKSIALAGMLALVCGASVARAQAPAGTRPERPYRGLFAGSSGDNEQTLTANASLGGGYDDNIYQDLNGSGTRDPRRAVSGKLGSASGSISYQLDKDRFGLGASVGSSLRFYPGQDEPYVSGYTASTGLRASLGRRSGLTAQQTVGYVPFLFTAVVPSVVQPDIGQVGPPAVDLVTDRTQYLLYSSSVGLSHDFSQRVSGGLNYGFQQRQTPLYGGRFTIHTGQANLGFQLARDLGLNLGYQRRQSEYPSIDRTVRQESINAGLDFSKALSFSRRTTVSFNTGSALVRTARATRYRALGSAVLNHEVGRSWLATANYNRNVIFVETLLDPVFSDSWSASFGGLITRRLQFQSSVGASLGRVGLDTPGSRFQTIVGSTGLSYAITRYVSVGANYSYYQYEFGDGVTLPPGVPRTMDRQSVRANLNLWMPLMNIARRPNASR
jgi:hypothetical protein